ncbi:saccharopine dehydrogenase family protein [Glaciecola sp. 1036]|uniref:saccharopine dehydrogenase family protein n=1 Tax=Alteromonadaceae TaxID=72275 RepID=UPI003D04C0F7
MAKKSDKFDFILYGATSFVGQIMCEYLADYDDEKISWAMAGRNESKLLEVKEKFGLEQVPHFVADAENEVLIERICLKTKVIISTVGPYALYGEPMVKMCVKTGTDYCDLTGEPQWIYAMINKYHEQAKQTGARIINSCGFDSVPSDLGVFKSQQLALEKTQQPALSIKMRVRKLKGGASGGTIASMMNILKETKRNPKLKKVLVNPYVLCPEDHNYTQRQKNHKKAEFDKELNIWTMPFVMASINERIVHRSNALLGDMYGENFLYDEAMSAKNSKQAKKFTFGLGAFYLGASISPIRSILEKYVLPKPGEGPSKKEQLKGMFDMRFYAELSNGENQVVQVTGDRDPGYGSTAKMLVQAALCIAKDIPKVKGGFWTPASAMAEPLTQRLEKHAGIEIQQLD